MNVFIWKTWMQKILLNLQTLFLFYLPHTRGQWFWAVVKGTVWVRIYPVPFTFKPVCTSALFFNWEWSKLSFLWILEGPLIIGSEKNDFANSPNIQISCHLSSLRPVAHSLPCGVVEEAINCKLESLISCLCTVIYHLCDPRWAILSLNLNSSYIKWG